MPQNQDLYDAIVNGDAKKARAATQVAIDTGEGPMELIASSMVPAMDEVGKLFEAEEYFVPELLLAGRAMKSAMELLRPLMIASGQKFSTRVVIGTVKGDLHDIGKNLCIMMLRGAGFEVIDLGVDTPPDAFIDAIETNGVKLLGMSALLTTTVPNMGRTIEAFIDAGLRDDVRIMVGGAPVTQEFADDMGADGYGKDAMACVALAKQLMCVSQ